MQKFNALVLSFLFAVTTSVFAAAPTKDDAQAMVKKAITFFKANGKEKSLQEFSNPKGQFVQGELYLTVWDTKGTQIAHGANAKLIGQNLIDLKDSDGKLFVQDFIKIGQKGEGANGWVTYKWTNPTSKKIEDKTVYLERVTDTIIGCGIYVTK